MVASYVCRLIAVGLGLLAAAPILGLVGCAQPTSEGVANVRFALSTTTAAATIAPTVRVTDVRVVNRHVNLREPVVMGTAGRDVTVTFALRQREGATVVLDHDSLEPRAVTPFTYPSRPRAAMPPVPSSDTSRVKLADGSSLTVWTDDASTRVLVQAFGPDGTWRGSPVVVSPENIDAFGAPQVTSADGRRAVVTFFASDGEGFQLVAASLESAR
jgi:hypothetical protein